MNFLRKIYLAIWIHNPYCFEGYSDQTSFKNMEMKKKTQKHITKPMQQFFVEFKKRRGLKKPPHVFVFRTPPPSGCGTIAPQHLHPPGPNMFVGSIRTMHKASAPQVV